MPFFMSDDGLYRHRKVRSLVEPVLLGDLDGVAALGMWDLAGCLAQDTLSDGLVSLPDLISIILDVTTARRLADRLVDAGLWHTHGHTCDRCEPVPPNHWRFHDWWDMRYKRGDVLRTARAKAKELKDEEIVNAVWWRDCIDPNHPKEKNRAHCRYGCGKIVNRYDRSSKDPNHRPELDHVDPNASRGVTNLVVACGECNRQKWRKTPAEAGLTLQPPPRTPPTDRSSQTADRDARPASQTTQGATTALAAAQAEAVRRSPQGRDRTDRSPQTADRDARPASQTTQGATTALAAAQAGTVRRSPHGRDAGRRQERRRESKASPESSAIAELKADPNRPPAGTGAGMPAYRRGSGSGLGVGVGGQGDQPQGEQRQGEPRPARRRRRRRRGRSRSQGELSTDAGASVRVPGVPVGGSPWHGWRGPPSPISSENVCPVHDLDQPCRKCLEEEP